MSDAPTKTIAIAINAADPLEAGGEVMMKTAVPVIRDVLAFYASAQRQDLRDLGPPLLYSGALAAFLAVMTADLGIEVAEEVAASLSPCFDEARKVRADHAAAAAPGSSSTH